MLPRSSQRRAHACAWRRLALFFCILACLACGRAAHAHASLIETDPADNSLLGTLPTRVTLRFNEPVDPLVFRLALPDGSTQALTTITAIDGGVQIALPPEDAPGTYGVSWRVISADGHPVGGTLLLSVGERSATTAGTDTNYARWTAVWLARVALYIALFVTVGGALFHAVCHAAYPPVRWVRRSIWIGLATIFASLPLQGLDVLNADWTGVFDPAIWQAALHTSYALTLAFAALAMGIASLSVHIVSPLAKRAAAAAAALVLAVAFAASGHASAAQPAWFARTAVALHTFAVAAWLGALLPLWHQGKVDAPSFMRALSTFSGCIRVVIALLLASGVGLVALQVDSLASLWRTPYGLVLLGKLGLVGTLFALAAWNRYRLTDQVMAGSSPARRHLVRLIAAEIAVAVCVLAVVALWRFTPPPRALHLAATPTLSLHIHQATAMADISVRPAGPDQAGSMDVMLLDANLSPLEPKALSVSFANADRGLEPLRREAIRLSPGLWRITPLALPQADRWTVRLDALVTDFDEIVLTGELLMSSPAPDHPPTR